MGHPDISIVDPIPPPAERCLNCLGDGVVSDREDDDTNRWTTTICPTCHGTGRNHAH